MLKFCMEGTICMLARVVTDFNVFDIDLFVWPCVWKQLFYPVSPVFGRLRMSSRSTSLSCTAQPGSVITL